MNPRQKNAAIKKLLAEAQKRIQWESLELERIEAGAEARRKAAEDRNLFFIVNRIQRISDKDIAKARLAKAIGISDEAMEQELRSADNELRDKLVQVFSDPKKADADKLAEYIYTELSNMGARFYRTPDESVCLFYKGLNYTISNNPKFHAFFHSQTGLNFSVTPGKTVLAILQNMAYTRGDFMDTGNWIHTDLGKNRIYLNLSSPHQKIISLVAGAEPQVLDNGVNEDGAMLTPSSQIKPFSYDPSADIGEGLKLFKRLVMETVPADNPQRYFLAAWALSAFLLDYQKNKALLCINGPSGVGKSTAGANITLLVCGQNLVGRGTGASATRIGTNSPYSLFDNLENRNLKEGVIDHLLLLANSSLKPKAKAGSDTEVMMQRLQSLCLITAIEPIPGSFHELVNRTVVLTVAKQHWSADFLDGEVEREILKHRDMILSSVFKMIAVDVLPNIDRRKHWAQWMARKFKGHAKERNNEHLTTMMVILEAMLKYVPWQPESHLENQAEELLTAWIAFQNKEAQSTEQASNEILTMFDDVCNIVTQRIKGAAPVPGPHKLFPNATVRAYYDPELLHWFFQTEDDSLPFADAQGSGGKKFVIHGSAAEIFMMLSRHCSKTRRMPYANPGAFASRLSNEFKIIQNGGWAFVAKHYQGATFVQNKAEHKHYCESKSVVYWRLEKELFDD